MKTEAEEKLDELKVKFGFSEGEYGRVERVEVPVFCRTGDVSPCPC